MNTGSIAKWRHLTNAGSIAKWGVHQCRTIPSGVDDDVSLFVTRNEAQPQTPLQESPTPAVSHNGRSLMPTKMTSKSRSVCVWIGENIGAVFANGSEYII